MMKQAMVMMTKLKLEIVLISRLNIMVNKRVNNLKI
jgi:hypothetical protein